MKVIKVEVIGLDGKVQSVSGTIEGALQHAWGQFRREIVYVKIRVTTAIGEQLLLSVKREEPK